MLNIMTFSEQFYAILRQACEKRGGQKELVEFSGIGQPVLNRILSGKTKDPGLHSVSAIIDALGYTLCLGGKSGESIELQIKLEKAQKSISELKEELAKAKGEAQGLQRALDKILEKTIINNEQSKFLELKSPSSIGTDELAKRDY